MQTYRWVLLVFGLCIGAAAQTNSQPQVQTAPAPAFGQNAPILSPENPPVSGLDEPSLDLRTATRSFISPALQVSESADSNGQSELGTSPGVQSVTRVLGAFDLQQFWPSSDLFLEYLGGGAFYSSPYEARQLQAAGMEGVTRWRTGQATLRDVFNYLPDGSFPTAYGGSPGFGLATGAGVGTGGGALPGSHVWSQTGAGLGDIPRLSNTAIVDLVQAINPVSAFTVAGGFSNAHFYDTQNCALLTNICLINSDQLTIEGGYSHLISRHDQIGVVYAFQLLQFPQATGGEVYLHIVNLRYSHNITGRLSFIASAGPEYSDLEQGGQVSQWSLSARVQLHYKLGHAALIASYEKFTSTGSGLFLGSNVQAARIGYTRPLGRTMDLYSDAGFSHNTPLQSLPTGLGAHASSYNEGSVGAIVRKHLGRYYDVFVAYRFSELGFNAPSNSPLCIDGSCGNIASRQIGTVGVEWHPRPTRIE